MSIRQKITPADTRERIVSVAEEHFRRIGYAKTTVADIATALGMSPANVYRFFASKGAINNAICMRCLTEVDRLVQDILAQDLPAPDKLKAILVGINRYYRETLMHEHRLHDMVEVAMAENWPAIDAHCQTIVGALAQVIAKGIEEGVFRAVEPLPFARTVLEASAKILHPTLIAQCAAQHDGDAAGTLDDQVERITALILAALRP